MGSFTAECVNLFWVVVWLAGRLPPQPHLAFFFCSDALVRLRPTRSLSQDESPARRRAAARRPSVSRVRKAARDYNTLMRSLSVPVRPFRLIKAPEQAAATPLNSRNTLSQTHSNSRNTFSQSNSNSRNSFSQTHSNSRNSFSQSNPNSRNTISQSHSNANHHRPTFGPPLRHHQQQQHQAAVTFGPPAKPFAFTTTSRPKPPIPPKPAQPASPYRASLSSLFTFVPTPRTTTTRRPFVAAASPTTTRRPRTANPPSSSNRRASRPPPAISFIEEQPRSSYNSRRKTDNDDSAPVADLAFTLGNQYRFENRKGSSVYGCYGFAMPGTKKTKKKEKRDSQEGGSGGGRDMAETVFMADHQGYRVIDRATARRYNEAKEAFFPWQCTVDGAVRL